MGRSLALSPRPSAVMAVWSYKLYMHRIHATMHPPLGQPLLTSRILILKQSAFGTAHLDIQDPVSQAVRLWDGPS